MLMKLFGPVRTIRLFSVLGVGFGDLSSGKGPTAILGISYSVRLFIGTVNFKNFEGSKFSKKN